MREEAGAGDSGIRNNFGRGVGSNFSQAQTLPRCLGLREIPCALLSESMALSSRHRTGPGPDKVHLGV